LVAFKTPERFKAPRLEVPLVLKPAAVMLVLEVKDLEMFKEPAKVEEPVPLKEALPVLIVKAVPVMAPDVIVPVVTKLPAVIPLVAVRLFERFKLPAKELEPTPVKKILPVPLMLPPVEIPVVACKPLESSRPPEKELEPVLVELYKPAVVNPPAVMLLVAVRDLEIFKEPLKELEPVELPVKAPVRLRVPLMVVLPPILATLVTSKLLETEALEEVKRPIPVMLFEAPVIAPPNEKALMVVAERALTPEILLLPKAKAPERFKAPRLEVPDVLKPVAVTVLLEVKDLVRSKLPAKELEPVLLEKMLPPILA
jgi:hypothetical protein